MIFITINFFYIYFIYSVTFKHPLNRFKHDKMLCFFEKIQCFWYDFQVSIYEGCPSKSLLFIIKEFYEICMICSYISRAHFVQMLMESHLSNASPASLRCGLEQDTLILA